MAKFLTGKELDDAISDVVFKAEKVLIILSPFIKLDKYFRTIFDNLASNSDVHIIIGFGKNERNIERSFNKEDFDYFQKFPNISIVYIPNLHAKYYANERKGIISSINLYDFSFKNNIEFGVLFEASFIGLSKTDIEAWEASSQILQENFAVFIRRPKYKKKFIIAKDYLGSDTQLDLTDDLIKNRKIEKKNIIDYMTEKSFIEVFKLDKKPTREEVEKSNQDSMSATKIIPTATSDKKIHEFNGFCIKCKTNIPFKTAYPYCKQCYGKLGQYHQVYDHEKYCHSCGNPSKVSQKNPVCNFCNSK